jgi:PilZ domain
MKQSSMPAKETIQDLRREPRLAAHGLVELTIDRPERRVVSGRLVDISTSGFRVAHSFTQLGTGETVRFRHPSGSGKARVVWNRIMGEIVETGFLIVS